MSQICTSSSEWVVEETIEPVESWAEEEQKKCEHKPWPLNWICWFVTVWVRITTWVIKHILVEIVKVVCIVVTGIIGGIMWPFAAAIDAVCQKCNAETWVVHWWLSSQIKFLGKEPSATNPDSFDYKFLCKCRKGDDKEVTITAKSDDEAKDKVKEVCKLACA